MSEDNVVMEPLDLKESTENKKISKLRQAIPQICAVTAENLLLITLGTTVTFATILIPGLQNPESDIKVDRDDISWISCINLIAALFGCLIGGPASSKLGRKRTMQLSMIPYILAWLIFYNSTRKEMIFSSLFIVGLTGGAVEAAVLTYVAEVSQPHLRGMLSSTLTMAVIIGVLSQFITGKFTDWRTASLINVIYPVVGFLALSLVPESPYWLAEKGRVKAAEKALCWLRGWVSPPQVQEELSMICKTFQNPTRSKKSWKEFTKRTFILPFSLIVVCFIIIDFSGSSTIQTYSVKIFNELKVPLDDFTATIYLGVAQLLGTVICVFVIHYTGKRLINFISISGAGLCYFGTALYLYLIKFNQIDADSYSWIPMILVIGSSFISHLGIRLLVWILAGEIFLPQVKSVATSAAVAINYGFLAIANKYFLGMTDVIGLSGAFLLYAGINFVGLAVLYVMLPETESRSLQEIEEHYAGIKSLKEKQPAIKKKKIIHVIL